MTDGEGIVSIDDEQIMVPDLGFLDEAGAESTLDDLILSLSPSASSNLLSHHLLGEIELPTTPVGLEIGLTASETDKNSTPVEEITFMSNLRFVGEDSGHAELKRKTQFEDLPHSPTLDTHPTRVCDVGKTMAKVVHTKRGSKAGEPRGKYKCGKCGHAKLVKDKTGDIWIPHVCSFVKRISPLVQASESKGCDASTNTTTPQCKKGFVRLASTSATNIEMKQLPRPYSPVDRPRTLEETSEK